MRDNRPLLKSLFDRGLVQAEPAALLWETVPPRQVAGDRVAGMLLGVAIGDALGAPTESTNPGVRRAMYGEVRDYLPNPQADYATGYPTDDTQLTFWTIECLLAEEGLVPEHLADRFCRERIFGIGSAVRQFVRNRKDFGLPWERCGTPSAGNGALMRIAGSLPPHLREGGSLFADAALNAFVTHNDRAAVSSAVAYAGMLWELTGMSAPPDAAWWWQRYVELAKGVEGESSYRPRGGDFADYVGPLWRFVAERLPEAKCLRLTTRQASDSWQSGAYLLETVPAVLYICAQHGADPEEAIVRAVNDTRDNDTVAAIVGAAMGALHGAATLPPRWRLGLTGRLGLRDDGRVQELINLSCEHFC